MRAIVVSRISAGLVRYHRGDGGEEALDELAIRLIVEVALEDLRRAGEREVHGLATQIGDRALPLVVDLGARALEQLVLLLLRLLEHLVPELLARGAALGDHALGVGARCLQRLLLLRQQPRRLLAIPLRATGSLPRALSRALRPPPSAA